MPEVVSKMEQRYDVVTKVMRDRFTITDVANTFNVSRQTVDRWLAKYEEGDLRHSPMRRIDHNAFPTRWRGRSRSRSWTRDATTSGDPSASSTS